MHRSKQHLRGRDASSRTDPYCGFPPYGSHLGYRRQVAAVDEPTSCVTLTRLGVRRVLGWRAFPSVPALRSTNSAADRSALFVGFPATMARSDFSCPYILGYGSSPSRWGPPTQTARPNTRPPSFRCDPFARDVASSRLKRSSSRRSLMGFEFKSRPPCRVIHSG
jgi:hypothetical protein